MHKDWRRIQREMALHKLSTYHWLAAIFLTQC